MGTSPFRRQFLYFKLRFPYGSPADADDEEKRANAVFSTVACKVGNDPTDRDHGPRRPPRDSPEVER